MTCERCAGAGWRQVDDDYAARIVPDLTLEDVAHLDGPATADVEREHERRRRVAAASSFPCNLCNADAYDRWVDGHFDPGHKRDGCAVCQAVDYATGKRTARKKPGVESRSTEGAAVSEPDMVQAQF